MTYSQQTDVFIKNRYNINGVLMIYRSIVYLTPHNTAHTSIGVVVNAGKHASFVCSSIFDTKTSLRVQTQDIDVQVKARASEASKKVKHRASGSLRLAWSEPYSTLLLSWACQRARCVTFIATTIITTNSQFPQFAIHLRRHYCHRHQITIFTICYKIVTTAVIATTEINLLSSLFSCRPTQVGDWKEREEEVVKNQASELLFSTQKSSTFSDSICIQEVSYSYQHIYHCVWYTTTRSDMKSHQCRT